MSDWDGGGSGGWAKITLLTGALILLYAGVLLIVRYFVL